LFSGLKPVLDETQAGRRFESDGQHRKNLINKRNRLFDKFLKNPKNTRLALEIKAIDDEIWELCLRKQRPVHASAN